MNSYKIFKVFFKLLIVLVYQLFTELADRQYTGHSTSNNAKQNWKRSSIKTKSAHKEIKRTSDPKY